MSGLLDAEMLQSYRELQTPEDPHFLRIFLGVFLGALPGHLDSIKDAIAQGDAKKLAASAHAVKSSCANVGVAPMVAICSRLEKLGKSGSVEGAQADCDELFRLLTEVTKEIHALTEFTTREAA